MSTRATDRTDIYGDRTRSFDPDTDRLPDHYPADTRAPFDLLIVPSTGMPAHIEAALQERAARERYAHPSTVNHDVWRCEHRACLATPGVAPGPPLPRRRRINWWSLVSGLAAAALILLSIVGTVAILQQIAER